jgi:tetratricopeptide (TPR) repeat protein
MALDSMGDWNRALPLIQESLAINRASGSTRELAWSLAALAAHLAGAGQLDACEPVLIECATVGRQSGDITPVLASTGALARLCVIRGDLTRARRAVTEALVLADQIDMKIPLANLLVTLGDIASAEHDTETAADWYRQALRAAGAAGARGVLAYALRHFAACCAARGDLVGAVRIFGATSTLHQLPRLALIDVPVPEAEIVSRARESLGEDACDIAWAAGRSTTFEQLLADLTGAAPAAVRLRST